MINQYNLTIISACKNVNEHLDENFHHICEFKKHFKNVNLIIAENDSYDNTFESLKKQISKYKIGELYNFNGLDAQISERTHRLSFLLNFLLKKVPQNTDYVVNIDFDGLLKNFNVNSLLSCFEYDPNTWDMMGANCNNRYYDVWTLRYKDLEYDCWDLIHHLNQANQNDNSLIKEYVGKKQIYIDPNEKLIPVNSCFGGLGIYKYKSISNINYSATIDTCECKNFNVTGNCLSYRCQHVGFHFDMISKNKSKLFINPRLLVNCQTEHLMIT